MPACCDAGWIGTPASWQSRAAAPARRAARAHRPCAAARLAKPPSVKASPTGEAAVSACRAARLSA